VDVISIIETFGLPLAGVIGLAFYISKKDKEAQKQNHFIQKELMEELDESFKRLEAIIIKLIDNSKKNEIKLEGILKIYKGLLDIISKLMNKDSNNNFKNKLEKFLKENK
tara:strand:- start:474 stop:803 length:330 start_codon:yes stop_codon:yes gene_type:complete